MFSGGHEAPEQYWHPKQTFQRLRAAAVLFLTTTPSCHSHWNSLFRFVASAHLSCVPFALTFSVTYSPFSFWFWNWFLYCSSLLESNHNHTWVWLLSLSQYLPNIFVFCTFKDKLGFIFLYSGFALVHTCSLRGLGRKLLVIFTNWLTWCNFVLRIISLISLPNLRRHSSTETKILLTSEERIKSQCILMSLEWEARSRLAFCTGMPTASYIFNSCWNVIFEHTYTCPPSVSPADSGRSFPFRSRSE